jgi:hypothetical protein
MVVAVADVAARATKVFLLWLPFGRPRFRDAGGIISSASVFFLLPSGIPSPSMAELLREDMAGLSSEERLKAEEEMGVRPQPRALSAFKEQR